MGLGSCSWITLRTKLLKMPRLDFVFPRIVPVDGRRHRSFPSIQSHAKGLRYRDSVISPPGGREGLWSGGGGSHSTHSFLNRDKKERALGES